MSGIARSIVMATMAVALLAAPAAQAQTFGPLSPADGAALATDPGGIPVAFSCPVYPKIDYGSGFIVYGGPSDYGASFSRSPELGTDGRLRQDAVVALDTGHRDSTLPEGQCSAALAAGGSRPLPQETPGTYYWQVWRICTCAPGGYEVGPVWRLTLRSGAEPQLRPPRRVFAGYPFVVPLRLAGIPDGTAVAVERSLGGRWRGVSGTTALGGAGEAVVTLPRGTHRLRASVRLGDEDVLSGTRTVQARKAKRWRTGGGDDGGYRGRSGTRNLVRFSVAANGRVVRGFSAQVLMVCPSALIGGQITTQLGTAEVRRAKIAPDGSFVAATTARDSAILIRGRLRRGRVSGGRAQLSVGHCSGSFSFTAARQR